MPFLLMSPTSRRQGRPLTLNAIRVPAALVTTTSSESFSARATFFVKPARTLKSIATRRFIMSSVMPGIMQIRPCFSPALTMYPRNAFSAIRPSSM